MAELKDTGDRTTVGGGAQRDMGGGKGRCDLLPLDVVGNMLGNDFFNLMNSFIYEKDDIELIYQAFDLVLEQSNLDIHTAFLNLAKHYEDGAKKYEANNWRKNMDEVFFCDSAIRHYLKWLRKDTDEPHLIACLWNLISLIWSAEHWRGNG